MRPCLVLAALVACGDNLQGLPFDQFDEASQRARCERLVRCGLFAESSTCDGFFRKRPNLDLEAAVAAGLVRYSGTAAELCLKALAAQSCDSASRDGRLVPDVCRSVFTGFSSAGEDCVSDEECESGVCVNPACGQLCCRGVCREKRAPKPVGGPCELDGDCVHDLACGRDGVCHVLGGEGDLCDDDNECAYGSACIGPSELMAGNCRKQPLLGEVCLYQRCAELGAICAGTCVPIGLAGSPCVSAKDCSPFTLCDSDLQRCVEVPTLGEPCSTICAGESWCDGLTHACADPKPNGEPCSASDQCASLFCGEGVVFDACDAFPQCFP